MAHQSKRRKVDDQPFCRTAAASAEKQDKSSTPMSRPMANMVQNRSVHPSIQQSKDHAVSQAQQECCMGNFKIFDSPFGNFLVPVIPTRADLPDNM